MVSIDSPDTLELFDAFFRPLCCRLRDRDVSERPTKHELGGQSVWKSLAFTGYVFRAAAKAV